MQLLVVLSLLVSFSIGGLIPRTTTEEPDDFPGCELVLLQECSATCNGGHELYKFACTDGAQPCKCPTNPILYECNNRPCLSKNATLLDIFYDAEAQNEEENDVEYYEDDDVSTVGPRRTRKPKTKAQ